MKSDMKKNLSRLVALGLVLVLGACVKDDPTGPGGPGRFRVSIQNPEVVETRSAASSGELTIDDAYVLEFNADGTYKGGDKVEQADILDNGTRSPSLLMKHGFTEGSRIVCLFNTGLGALPAARCHHDGGTQYALPRHVVEYQPPRSGRQPGHTDVGGDELLVRGCVSGEAFGGEDHRRI